MKENLEIEIELREGTTAAEYLSILNEIEDSFIDALVRIQDLKYGLHEHTAHGGNPSQYLETMGVGKWEKDPKALTLADIHRMIADGSFEKSRYAQCGEYLFDGWMTVSYSNGKLQIWRPVAYCVCTRKEAASTNGLLFNQFNDMYEGSYAVASSLPTISWLAGVKSYSPRCWVYDYPLGDKEPRIVALYHDKRDLPWWSYLMPVITIV